MLPLPKRLAALHQIPPFIRRYYNLTEAPCIQEGAQFRFLCLLPCFHGLDPFSEIEINIQRFLT